MAVVTDFELLNTGEVPAKNLGEILKVDFAKLAKATFKDLPQELVHEIHSLQSIGILKRMIQTATILKNWNANLVLETVVLHPSDTVRGWGAFIVGSEEVSLAQKLAGIKPFADDDHFGVREWAWMAVREDLSLNLAEAVDILLPWTSDDSPWVRRFASESLRPRGVWAAHIDALKKNPEIVLPILERLKSDPERYVQDSVANWLNDAAKSQPEWVKAICASWKKNESKATAYIIKRAQRSL